jgi:hypothetical protein
MEDLSAFYGRGLLGLAAVTNRVIRGGILSGSSWFTKEKVWCKGLGNKA